MKAVRAALGWIRTAFDRRDLVGAVGVALICFGGERLYPGAGMTASGFVLVAIVTLVH